MADLKGLGVCPVCTLDVEVGQPAQYFAGGGHGNVMAHTTCVTAWRDKVNTPEYKREQAHQKVARAEAAVAAALSQLNHVKEELRALDDDSG